MKVRIGQDDALALDCVQPLGRDHVFVQGWLSWPQGGAMPALRLLAGGLPLESAAEILHDRADLTSVRDAGRAARGFLLAMRRPSSDASFDDLHLEAGPDRIALPASPLGAPIAEVLARQPWDAVFGLLTCAAADARLGAACAPVECREGVFERWIASVPRLTAPTEGEHGLLRAEAIATALGEVAVAITLPRPLGPQEMLRGVVLMPAEGGQQVLHLEGPAPLRAESGATLYGRLAMPPRLPVPPFDVLVALEHPQGGAWFRMAPRLMPAPDFLLALHRLNAAGDAVDGFAWLRGVLDLRRDAFDDAFGAARAAGIPGDAPGAAPVLAVLYEVDDPFAARLIALAAPEIERRAAEVVVLGAPEAATEVANAFLLRGRIPTRIGLDLPAAVRRGTYARTRLVPIEPAALARALETRALDRLFARAIDGAALMPLLRLAAAAGRPDGGDAFPRLAQILDDDASDPAIRRYHPRIPGAAGHLIAEHLAALWHDAAQALRPQAPHEPR